MEGIWGTMKTFVWTAGVLSFIALLLCCLAIVKTQYRASQADYLLAFGVALVVLFILMVFCWYLMMATKNLFVTDRA